MLIQIRQRGAEFQLVTGRRIFSRHASQQAADAALEAYKVSHLGYAPKPATIKATIKATISIHQLRGERALLVKSIPLEGPKDQLLEVLAATRAGLPPDHGASLTTPDGRNVY